MRGAGGTNGGIGRFFLGLTMLIGGGFLFFNSITVTNNFSLRYSLYSYGSFHLTSGIVLVPFLFGIGMIFYNSKNFLGWILAGGSLTTLVLGVISSIHFRMAHMSAFHLIVILVLFIGGLGLFLSSLKGLDQMEEDARRRERNRY